MLHRGGAPSTSRRSLTQSKENDVSNRAFGKNQAPSSDSLLKTPARSVTKRRALGDISNRKQGGTTAASVQRSGLKKHHQTPNKQQRSGTSAFVLPKTTATTKKSTATFVAPTPQQQKKRVVSFDVHSDKPIQEQKPRQVFKPTPAKGRAVIHDDVPDVELPAGRLWKQQQEEDPLLDFSMIHKVQRDRQAAEDAARAEVDRGLARLLEERRLVDKQVDKEVEEMLNEIEDLVDNVEHLKVPSDDEESVSLGLEEGYSSLDDEEFFRSSDIPY